MEAETIIYFFVETAMDITMMVWFLLDTELIKSENKPMQQ